MAMVMVAVIRRCNEATILQAIVDTSKNKKLYRVFFHFTAPEAGGKPKPYTQQSNRDRERFVPRLRRRMVALIDAPSIYISWVDKKIK